MMYDGVTERFVTAYGEIHKYSGLIALTCPLELYATT